MSVAQDIQDAAAQAVVKAVKRLGEEISNVINQDDKTDEDLLYDIVELLRRYKIYKERE